MNILLTGSGCPGWYSIFTALQEWAKRNNFSILGSDMLPITAGGTLAKQNFTVPSGNDPGYIDEMLQVVEQNDIRVIVPLTDPELAPLAYNSPAFEDIGCKVLASPGSQLETMLDKGKLYEGLRDISPNFVYCDGDHIEALVKGFIELFSDGGSCFVKLVTAYGSRGTKKVISDENWLDGFDKKKPEAFGSSFPIGQMASLSKELKMMVLETLPGAEYSIDCIYHPDGGLVFYGVRERETTRNGICHTARFVVDSDGEFLSFIRRVNEFVKMRYNINIQAKRDKGGQLKLLEINPRMSGSLNSFFAAGYNLAEMCLDIATGSSVYWEGLTPTEYKIPRAYRVSFFV